MFKSIFTVLLLMLFVFVSSNALLASDVKQDLRLKPVHKQIVTDEMEAEMQSQIRANAKLIDYTMSSKQPTYLNKIMADGDTVGWTVRDFTMNTCMGRKIAFDPATGNVHVVFTQWEPNAVDPYHEQYNFFDDSFDLWFGTQSIDPSLDGFQTRSGRVLVGPNGEGWVSFHKHSPAGAQESFLAYDNAPGDYAFTRNSIATGNFASADYKDAGMTWFSTNDQDSNFEVDRLFKSTDGGVNWTQTGAFLEWPADNAISNVEIYPHFNPANGDIDVFYHNGLSGASLDTSRFYWANSSDLGDNWTFTTIYHEPAILSNNVKYHNDNFSQLMTETDENGVIHMAFNGYGVMTNGISPDSVEYVVMDVVYWNSNMSSFDETINLADSLHSRNAPVTLYANSNDVGSGNNMGNAFPSIAIGPNGVLAVIWEQGELAPGDTTLVIATDPTGTPDPAGIYANDLYCAVSGDGGSTWSEPFYIDGAPEKCDRSPSLAKTIEFDGTNYFIHYVYMHDPDPGQDLPNPPAWPAAWVYGKYDITSHIIINSIDENDNVVNNFELSQNYPNPFNPSTNIKFNLSKATDVTLDIFNVLGEKVATLINGKVKAGETVATFSGANFSSGVYFYQLTAGDLVQKKKMLLVK